MRARVVRRLGWLACALALHAAGACSGARNDTSPADSIRAAESTSNGARTEPSWAVTGTNSSPFGVHRDGPFPTRPEIVLRIVEIVRASGADWMRVNVAWEWIEPNEGAREWPRLDRIVDAAGTAGIALLVTIRGYTQTPLYSNDSQRKLAAYELFIAELAGRYKNRIKYWQIENEVTARNMWRGSPDDYLAVLATAHDAIKKENPTAQVLLASFGSGVAEPILYQPDSRRGQEAASQMRYLLFRGADHYDIVDIHAYHSLADVTRRIDLIRGMMESFGKAAPVWVSETGGPDPRSVSITDTLRTTADQALKRYVSALSAGAERVFWHQISMNPGKTDYWSHMGLLLGEERQPAFYSYQTMASKLRGLDTVERLDSEEGTFIYRVRKDEAELYVLWADLPTWVSLPIEGGGWRASDIFGATTEGLAEGINVGPSPLYVERAE